jgi:hypothetical protein
MTKKGFHGEAQPGQTLEEIIMTLFYSLPLASVAVRSDNMICTLNISIQS